MIITKYLVRETLKKQFIIFVVLLIIFFCQKLLKIFGSVVDNNIPINITFLILFLNMTEISQILLPFSLFLGILITFNKLYSENEIIIIYYCGFGKKIIIRSVLILIMFTASLETCNLFWLSPLSNFYQKKILLQNKYIFETNKFNKGNLKLLKNKNSVLFIKKIKKNNFINIFFAKIKNNKENFFFIILSKNAKIYKKNNGKIILIFYNGKFYKKYSNFKKIFITYFNKYILYIDKNLIKKNFFNIKQMNLNYLYKHYNDNIKILTELSWRVTLILSVLIMGMLILPISLQKYNSKKVVYIIISIFLYFIFFVLQASFYSNGINKKNNTIIEMWILNIIYFLIIFISNIQETFFLKKILLKFKK